MTTHLGNWTHTLFLAVANLDQLAWLLTDDCRHSSTLKSCSMINIVVISTHLASFALMVGVAETTKADGEFFASAVCSTWMLTTETSLLLADCATPWRRAFASPSTVPHIHTTAAMHAGLSSRTIGHSTLAATARKFATALAHKSALQSTESNGDDNDHIMKQDGN